MSYGFDMAQRLSKDLKGSANGSSERDAANILNIYERYGAENNDASAVSRLVQAAYSLEHQSQQTSNRAQQPDIIDQNPDGSWNIANLKTGEELRAADPRLKYDDKMQPIFDPNSHQQLWYRKEHDDVPGGLEDFANPAKPRTHTHHRHQLVFDSSCYPDQPSTSSNYSTADQRVRNTYSVQQLETANNSPEWNNYSGINNNSPEWNNNYSAVRNAPEWNPYTTLNNNYPECTNPYPTQNYPTYGYSVPINESYAYPVPTYGNAINSGFYNYPSYSQEFVGRPYEGGSIQFGGNGWQARIHI